MALVNRLKNSASISNFINGYQFADFIFLVHKGYIAAGAVATFFDLDAGEITEAANLKARLDSLSTLGDKVEWDKTLRAACNAYEDGLIDSTQMQAALNILGANG